MSNSISVDVRGDASNLGSSLNGAQQDLNRFSASAAAATGAVANGFDVAGGRAAQLGGAFGDLAGGFEVMGMQGVADQLNMLAPLMMFAAGAADLFAVAQAALNAVMAMNPIVLVVIALVALTAGFVIAYKKSETFRDIVNQAFEKVQEIAGNVADFFTVEIPKAFDKVSSAAGAAIGWVRDNWPTILAILTGPFGLAVLAITKNWDNIKDGARNAVQWVREKFDNLVGFFTGMPARMRSAVAGIWGGIKDSFKSTLNTIIGWWNDFSLSVDIPDAIPGLPDSFTINTPNVPMLANGGRADRASHVIIGDGNEPESVMPDSMMEKALARAAAAGAGLGGGGGVFAGATFNIQAHSYNDFKRQLERDKENARSSAANSGVRWPSWV